jgi:heterodisulfide reductase subunit D
MAANDRLRSAIAANKVVLCLECGKCTSICPAHKADPTFSPRGLVKQGILQRNEELGHDGSLWSCITCRLCKEVCVSDVDIPEFVRAIRQDAQDWGNKPHETHGGIVQAMDALMEDPALRQDRLWWLQEGMKVNIDGHGEVLLFTGCSPHYDIIFRDLDRNADIPRAAVRILNALGIVPVLLSNERCCGHDELWTGGQVSFERMRALNRRAIEATGAGTIVTPCPECAHTLKEQYGLGAQVVHLTQFLARHLSKDKLSDLDIGPFAFHDPCRLGRFMHEYDAPREVLGAIPGADLRTMQFEKEISHCCGVSAWINCTEGSRRLRHDRLKEAEEAGAETLVTACPKCRIHFNCYLANKSVESVNVKVEDLTILVARAMGVWR